MELTAGANDRVLVVDGDSSARASTCSLLRGSGFSVDAASSGAVALERFLVFRPDAVVFDFWMPVMDGRELVHALRELSRTRVALIAVSDAPEVEDWCRRVVIDGFVAKPIVGERLVQTLRVALDDSRASVSRPPHQEPMTSRKMRIASAVLVVGDGAYAKSTQLALREMAAPVQVACVSSVEDALRALRAIAVDAIAVVGTTHTRDPRFVDMAAECAARGVHVVVDDPMLPTDAARCGVLRSDDASVGSLVARVRQALDASVRSSGAA